jgi:hypothetical protein
MNYSKVLISADLKSDVIFFNQVQIGAMDEQDYQNLVSLHPDERSIRVNDEIIADEIIFSDYHPTGVWFDPIYQKFYEVKAFEN